MRRLLNAILALTAVALAGCGGGSGIVRGPQSDASQGLITSLALQRGNAVVAPRTRIQSSPVSLGVPVTRPPRIASPPPPAGTGAVAAAPAPGPDPIIALGDSITYGYGTGAGASAFGPPPTHSYPWYLARDLGIPVVNAGVSGTTAYGLLDPTNPADSRRPASLRLPALLAMHPRLVVLGFGSNEAVRGWPIRETAHHLDLLLGRFDAASVPVVLLGTHIDCVMMPCPTAPGSFRQRYTNDWDAALGWLAAKHGAQAVVDVEKGFTPDELTDWIHPSSLGYSLIARRVGPAVLRALAGERPSAPSTAATTPSSNPPDGQDRQLQPPEARRDPPRPGSIWDGEWGGGRTYLRLPILDLLGREIASFWTLRVTWR